MNRLANASARGETSGHIKMEYPLSNEIIEITEDLLEEISGGLQCKPGQVPTNIYNRETGLWSTFCDG